MLEAIERLDEAEAIRLAHGVLRFHATITSLQRRA